MFRLFIILSILTQHPLTRDANVGVLIYDYHSHDTIASYRANNVIPPASTIKLFTCATALEMYGPDYCFETPITYSGTLRDGTLDGNIYVEGVGDPTFGSRFVGNRSFLYQWLKPLQQMGIKHITGSVIVDVSYFDADALNPSWTWEDAGNYYAPGIYAVSYLDNTMNIVLRSGPIGSIAEVLYTYPEVPDIRFENHIRCTERNNDGAYVHGVPYDNQRYLVGSVPANRKTFGVGGDLPNPPLTLARDITKILRYGGIQVDGDPSYMSEAPYMMPPRHHLFTQFSEPISTIIAHTNHRSDNMYAEMLFRGFAARYGTPCTIHNACTFVRQYWHNHGVFLTSARILDGCGLAPFDALSPAMFVNLLQYMYGSPYRDAWLRSLPCSGESGTLSSFLRHTELHGRVLAKSGTIMGTKNYAGYIFLPDGRVWVFAIMVSSADENKAKSIIEKYLLDVYRANI